MKTFKKTLTFILAILMAVFLFVGCGGNSDESVNHENDANVVNVADDTGVANEENITNETDVVNEFCGVYVLKSVALDGVEQPVNNVSQTIEIKNDAKAVLTMPSLVGDEGDVAEGTWTVKNGNVVALSFGDHLWEVTINENALTHELNGMKYTYKK